ncbi:MAG: HAD family hydrolase [Candidatus Zixiibacteriota bacterium]
MQYRNIRGVIFDLGSTLIEFEHRPWPEITQEAQEAGYRQLAEHNGGIPDFDTFNNRLEEIKNEFREMAMKTLKEWKINTAFEKLLMEFEIRDPIEQSNKFVATFYEIVRNGITLCDGVYETLSGLKECGIPMGIISNTIFPGDEHDVDLVNYEIMQYFDFRIYSYDFGWRKPWPDIYRYGLKLIDLPPENTVYVGDRFIEDVLGPQELGMNGVLKYREGREYPEPMPDGFPVIHRLDELLKIIA